jgi:hypothetical protein
MRFRPTGGLDLTTGALLAGGACLVALSIVAAVSLISPQSPQTAAPAAPVQALPERPAAALPPGRVATVLSVDAATGASTVARVGDHVDVFGYFPHQVTGGDAVTRVLVQDVPVLTVERSGPGVALTLSVEQPAALQLQEAEALGVRPFVAVRPFLAVQTATSPTSFSDTDMARRLGLSTAGTR